MKQDSFRREMGLLLASADIRIGGDRPWDIQVHDDRFYTKVLAQGSLGLSEAYMDGWWDCEQLDEFFSKALAAQLDTRVRSWTICSDTWMARLFNLQTPSRAYWSGQFHYDR